MAAKSNIRSIRFSNELAELIDRQQGRNFTEKFENLVTRCVWELPSKKKELKALEQRISEKRRQLMDMSTQVREISISINELAFRTIELEDAIDKAISKWGA